MPMSEGTASSASYAISIHRPKEHGIRPDSLQLHQIPGLILPSLHLTVDYSCVLSSSIDMVYLGDEACIGDCWVKDVIYID